MRILHYFLGFPPYRSGGLTKFAYDLMLTQIEQGDDVSALWPGQIRIFSDKVVIKSRKPINKIKSYEIINPLPVPYDEGISTINAFIKAGVGAEKAYGELLGKEHPDVVHIHTFMGLHREFLEVAQNKTWTVFTTHDFYPICPKVTMFRDGKVCDCNYINCPKCNMTALSLRKIVLLQNPVYRMVKDNPFVKQLRANHRNSFFVEQKNRNDGFCNLCACPNDYKELRQYYASMMSMVDVIHYNSSVALDAYERCFHFRDSARVPVAHRNIRDQKKEKRFEGKLKLSYLGPGGGAKGFFLLKEALDELWMERQDFLLNLYFQPSELSPYMKVHTRYDYAELEKVFDDTDILVVPSIWNETFGFTVLEALSFGTPVMVSPTVGAKDIIANGCGVVLADITKRQIIDTLNGLTKESLERMNRCILERQSIVDIWEVSQEIKSKCYKRPDH